MLVEGKLGERKGKIAHAWLAEKDSISDAEQREIDRNIARGANLIAGQARTRARWANGIAIAALMVAIAAVASSKPSVSASLQALGNLVDSAIHDDAAILAECNVHSALAAVLNDIEHVVWVHRDLFATDPNERLELRHTRYPLSERVRLAG